MVHNRLTWWGGALLSVALFAPGCGEAFKAQHGEADVAGAAGDDGSGGAVAAGGAATANLGGSAGRVEGGADSGGASGSAAAGVAGGIAAAGAAGVPFGAAGASGEAGVSAGAGAAGIPGGGSSEGGATATGGALGGTGGAEPGAGGASSSGLGGATPGSAGSAGSGEGGISGASYAGIGGTMGGAGSGGSEGGVGGLTEGGSGGTVLVAGGSGGFSVAGAAGTGGAEPCVDTDEDGSCDTEDACPTDPEKVTPGVCGCGNSDIDSNSIAGPDCVDHWRCDLARYRDGASCDCGCGAPDPDCAQDASRDACDTCSEAGSCGVGSCPANIDPYQNSSCHQPPASWHCPALWYGDADPSLEPCDCGCGAIDPSCVRGTGVEVCDFCGNFDRNGVALQASCANALQCDGSTIDPDNIATCLAPPPGWTCPEAQYADGARCQCGCGTFDPDCGGTAAADCDDRSACPDESIWDLDNSVCIPLGWRCQPNYYGDGDCDCGCGALDPDCGAADDVSLCDFCVLSGSCAAGRACSAIDPSNTASCAIAPPEWTCAPESYGDEVTCHCGCGALDPDCGSLGKFVCDDCNDPNSCDPDANCEQSTVDKYDSTICSRWTCPLSWYGDGQCDCGCGSVDSDCSDPTIASCDYCSGTGSCGVGACDSAANLIDPNNNGRCLPSAEWTCSLYAYGSEDGCHCGCGSPDPDCDSNAIASCDSCSDPGSCDPGSCLQTNVYEGYNAVCSPPGWRCNPEFYGDSQCDCGCGIIDIDCTTADGSPDPSVEACQFCSPEQALMGSCGVGNCAPTGSRDPANILATDNSSCSVPASWACSAATYGDGQCDCGCGALDPDCAGSHAIRCARCNSVGSCSSVGCDEPASDIVETLNWSCSATSGG